MMNLLQLMAQPHRQNPNKRVSQLAAPYQHWRNQILHKRMLILWGAIMIFLAISLLFDAIASFFTTSEKLSKLADTFAQAKITHPLIEMVVTSLVVAYSSLHNHPWWRKRPYLLFLFLSWLTTLLPQVVLTFVRASDSGVLLEILGIAFLQAIFVPIAWKLHGISLAVPLLYYISVNSIPGFVTSQAQTVFNQNLLSTVIFCCGCVLLVFIHERVHRHEFRHRYRLETFLQAVSNDLKSPALGTTSTLNAWFNRNEAETWISRTELQQLFQANERQSRLIQALLATHYSEDSAILLNLAAISVQAVVSGVLYDLAPILTQKQVQIDNRLRNDLPLVNGDEIQLWRVYSDLIHQAIQHDPPAPLAQTTGSVGLQLIFEAEVIRRSQQNRKRQWWNFHWSKQFLNQLYLRCWIEVYHSPSQVFDLQLCQQIIHAQQGEIDITVDASNRTRISFTVPLHQFELVTS